MRSLGPCTQSLPLPNVAESCQFQLDRCVAISETWVAKDSRGSLLTWSQRTVVHASEQNCAERWLPSAADRQATKRPGKLDRPHIGVSILYVFSVFDVFKVGSGPLSSHTMRPMSGREPIPGAQARGGVKDHVERHKM